MASHSAEWRQASFVASVLQPRLRAWPMARATDAPDSVHARVLVSDALLWQALGVELGYFDEASAERATGVLHERVFDRIYDWLAPWKKVMAPAAIDWLLRIREEGLRRPDVSRYARASSETAGAFQAYFQAALLSVGRSTLVGDGLASSWVAHLMYADDDAWQSIVERFGRAAPSGDADLALGDGATSTLAFMDGTLDLLNASAQDARLDDLDRDQFSADLGLLLTWPLNLESDVVRRRFDAFFAAAVDALQHEHDWTHQQALRVREDITRLADAWRETVGAAAAVAYLA